MVCGSSFHHLIFFFFQVGIVVYGYRPKIWFLLNSHDRSDTLLQKIQSTPFDETPGNNIGQTLEIFLCLERISHLAVSYFS